MSATIYRVVCSDGVTVRHSEFDHEPEPHEMALLDGTCKSGGAHRVQWCIQTDWQDVTGASRG